MPTMPTRTKKVVAPAVEAEESNALTQRGDTVTFKRSHFYSVLVVLAFAAGILVGYVAWGLQTAGEAVQTSRTANQSSGSVVGAPVATEEAQYVRYDVFSEDAYVLGPEDAPITIVEFGDFQCPYCRRWHEEVFAVLSYPGQIRIVYRHLPLTSIHPDAFAAAEAAMCAGEQSAFWEYHDKLFSSETLGTDVYTQYAQDLNLDMTAFEACMTEHRYQQAIQKDSDFAIDLGISSTPTFFINGLAIVGTQPLDVFQQVIDKELAGEILQ